MTQAWLRKLPGVIVLALLAVAAYAQEADQCIGVVSLLWPGHELSHAQVRVFKDAGYKDLVESFPATGAEGKVVLVVPPGSYYLTAVVDLDNDGKISPGDGLGFHGVADPATDRPTPLQAKDKAFVLELPITFTVGEGGKLTPNTVARPPAPTATTVKMVALSGKVTGGGTAGVIVAYAVPKSGQGAFCAAVVNATEGSFVLQVPSGDYYLFAVQDANQDEKVGAGDLMAVYGYTAEQGRLFPTATFADTVGDLQLALQWRLTDTGLLKAVEGEAEGPLTAPDTIPAVVYGELKGQPAQTAGAVRVATDAGFSEAAGTFVTDNGHFVLALPKGLYFLSAMVDADGNGQASPGDLLGFYGIDDFRLGHGPQPLLVTGGELRPLDLKLSAQLDGELRPVARVNTQQ